MYVSHSIFWSVIEAEAPLECVWSYLYTVGLLPMVLNPLIENERSANGGISSYVTAHPLMDGMPAGGSVLTTKSIGEFVNPVSFPGRTESGMGVALPS